MTTPQARLTSAVANPQQLARKAIKDPRWLESVMGGLSADTARVKYGCAKALGLVSEARPDVLYPQFDIFVSLLDHENKILQWHAIFVLSHLARADTKNRFAAVFEKYFSPIQGPVMITAANLIQGGARIAAARPELADRIAAEVLKVGKARYRTAECRNVAIGHAILALGEVFDLLQNPAAVVRFVRKQLENPRPATRKKAEKFLTRIERRAKNRQT